MTDYIPELGHFALALAVAIAGAQAVLGFVGASGRDGRMMAGAAGLALGQVIAVAVAFGALVWSSVVDDFSVQNVAEHSHSLKPLLYKVTGAWGNHEGSIVLWCLILAACGACVSGFGRGLPSALRSRVVGVLGLVSAGFLLFTLLTSNPLLRVWPPPDDGRDMNPLLQDPGLAFHPPLLYAGYVGFAVPFAFAVAALLEGRVDAAWGRWVRPWALGAWSLLTGGIALGSWWAYYELGWGGYWFWDPVENASLLPWLTGTALLHSAIVVEKRDALKTWTVLLAIATFSLSLCGTFLVRSGILNSVHSFASDPTRGVFILGLLVAVIGGSLVLFAWRAPALVPTGIFAPVSREGGLIVNNVLICSIAAVVFCGTLFPLFAELLFGAKISVGAPFFNQTVLPLAVPLLLAMPVGLLLPWKRASLGPALRQLWVVAVAAGLVGAAVGFGLKVVLPALGFVLAAWLVLGSLADIAGRVRLFRVPVGASLARLAGLPLSAWAAAVAHAGMGVLVAGVAGMGLAQDRIAAAAVGESVALAGYQWKLDSLADTRGSNFNERISQVTISRDGAVVAVLHPGRRTFTTQRMTTTEAAIHTTWMVDFYAVLGEERDGKAVLRLHYNPLAPWIWLGAMVMSFGGGLSLADRRLRVGAPSRRAAPAQGARA